MPTDEGAAFQELLGLIKALHVDVSWVRKKLEEQAVDIKGLDVRVRDLEQAVERVEAKQKPPISWTAIMLAGASVVGVIIIILDRFYVAR